LGYKVINEIKAVAQRLALLLLNILTTHQHSSFWYWIFLI